MAELMEYLQQAVDRGASDLFLVAGGPVSVKEDGRLVPLGKKAYAPGQPAAPRRHL